MYTSPHACKNIPQPTHKHTPLNHQLEAQLVELDADAVAAALQAATAARDEKAASLEAAQAAVTAAECALAGAQAGDGRDASNRSMQERLQDAKLAQVRGCVRG